MEIKSKYLLLQNSLALLETLFLVTAPTLIEACMIFLRKTFFVAFWE